MAEGVPASDVTEGTSSYPSASACVRTQPVDVPAKQVVAAGAKIGLKVTPNLVRIVRYKMRRAGLAKPVGPEKRPLRKARGTVAPASTASEMQFRKLILQVGTARARTLIDAVESRLEDLISAG